MQTINIGTRSLIVGLRLYQAVAASGLIRSLGFVSSGCRFVPSCSTYSIQALRRYGVCRGLKLIVARLIKCQPFHPGGLDKCI